MFVVAHCVSLLLVVRKHHCRGFFAVSPLFLLPALDCKSKAGSKKSVTQKGRRKCADLRGQVIISKENFALAQKVIRGGGRNPTCKQHDHPLKGLVRCGNCKRAMTRRKNTEGAPRVCFIRLQRAKRAGRSDIHSPQKGDALLGKLQAGAALPHRLATHYFIFASIRLSQMLMPIETSTPTSAMPQIMR